MKIIATITFSLSLLLISPVSIAGPGHEHDSHGGHAQGPISDDKVSAKAKNRVQHLIESGKIAKSWEGLSATQAVQKTYSKGPEWVVTFDNKNISDLSKQTLFLFYTLDGHYIAANFTGN